MNLGTFVLICVAGGIGYILFEWALYIAGAEKDGEEVEISWNFGLRKPWKRVKKNKKKKKGKRSDKDKGEINKDEKSKDEPNGDSDGREEESDNESGDEENHEEKRVVTEIDLFREMIEEEEEKKPAKVFSLSIGSKKKQDTLVRRSRQSTEEELTKKQRENKKKAEKKKQEKQAMEAMQQERLKQHRREQENHRLSDLLRRAQTKIIKSVHKDQASHAKEAQPMKTQNVWQAKGGSVWDD